MFSKGARALRTSVLPRTHQFRSLKYTSSPVPKTDLTVPVEFPRGESKSFPAAEPARITKLTNGLRVATVENFNPMSGIALFVDVGSRWENRENNGICNVIERMSLQSTKQMHTAEILATISNFGANVMISTSRDSMVFYADTPRDYTDEMLHVVSRMATQQEFNSFELHDTLEAYGEELKEKESTGSVDTSDAIHAAAFGSSTYGLPVFPRSSQLGKFTAQKLREFVSTHFTPDRIVIAASGVQHDSFVKTVEDFWLPHPRRTSAARPDAKYVGGDFRAHVADESSVQFVVAAEAVNWHDKDLVPLCVLQSLMGGGSSFSAGGPGKGMYSRLYTNVLNQHHWAQNAFSFISVFNETGIFGIAGSADVDSTDALTSAIIHEFTALKKGFNPQEVSRAKNHLKSVLLLDLERRSVMLEDMCRQTVVYNKIRSPQELVELVDAVTPEDLSRVSSRFLNSRPSVAMVGNLSNAKRYDQLVEQITQSLKSK